MAETIKNGLLITIALSVCAIIDICSYFLFEQHVIHLLFCLLVAIVWYRPSLIVILAGFCLLATELFIINGSIGAPFYLAATLLTSSFFLKDHVYSTAAYPALLSSIYLVFTIYLSHDYTPWSAYTVAIIFANLMIVGLFSLKLKTSKTGQSLMPLV